MLEDLKDWNEQLSSDAARKVEWPLSDIDPQAAKEARSLIIELVSKLDKIIERVEAKA